jgi:hypothetical protein
MCLIKQILIAGALPLRRDQPGFQQPLILLEAAILLLQAHHLLLEVLHLGLALSLPLSLPTSILTLPFLAEDALQACQVLLGCCPHIFGDKGEVLVPVPLVKPIQMEEALHRGNKPNIPLGCRWPSAEDQSEMPCSPPRNSDQVQSETGDFDWEQTSVLDVQILIVHQLAGLNGVVKQRSLLKAGLNL